MARKKKIARKKEITDEDILRARTVRRGLHPENLSYREHLELVGMHYPDIHGKPLEQLSEEQIFSIAERLYNESGRIYRNPTSYEKPFVGRINRLKAEKHPDKRIDLAERLCIELEAEPKDSYLSKMLDRALNRREGG